MRWELIPQLEAHAQCIDEAPMLRFCPPVELYEIEIAPELTGHGLPFIKCKAYNRVYDQSYRSR